MRGSSELWFATSNDHKFEEARVVLGPYRLNLRRALDKGTELQSDDLGLIAAHAATKAHSRLRRPLFTEDTGLYIKALNGFPGPYASQAYRTLGLGPILRLVPRAKREAQFVSAVAYCEGSRPPRVFKGVLKGELTFSPRGRGGFGFDPIFAPIGSTKTLAQMSMGDKCAVSHRGVSLRRLGTWLESRRDG